MVWGLWCCVGVVVWIGGSQGELRQLKGHLLRKNLSRLNPHDVRVRQGAEVRGGLDYTHSLVASSLVSSLSERTFFLLGGRLKGAARSECESVAEVLKGAVLARQTAYEVQVCHEN